MFFLPLSPSLSFSLVFASLLFFFLALSFLSLSSSPQLSRHFSPLLNIIFSLSPVRHEEAEPQLPLALAATDGFDGFRRRPRSYREGSEALLAAAPAPPGPAPAGPRRPGQPRPLPCPAQQDETREEEEEEERNEEEGRAKRE